MQSCEITIAKTQRCYLKKCASFLFLQTVQLWGKNNLLVSNFTWLNHSPPEAYFELLCSSCHRADQMCVCVWMWMSFCVYVREWTSKDKPERFFWARMNLRRKWLHTEWASQPLFSCPTFSAWPKNIDAENCVLLFCSIFFSWLLSLLTKKDICGALNINATNLKLAFVKLLLLVLVFVPQNEVSFCSPCWTTDCDSTSLNGWKRDNLPASWDTMSICGKPKEN